MSLRTQWDRALAEAEARAGAAADGRGASGWVPLPKGAQFAVRVDTARTQVILARRDVPVGFPTEEVTFCRHFGVPAAAARQDHGRTRDGWYKVSFTWERVPLAPLPEEELPL